MKTIEIENGKLEYSYEDDVIILDLVEVIEKRKGTGRQLVQMLIAIAEEEGKDIELCAYPQDDSIELADLVYFYEDLGFSVEYDTGSEVLMKYEI